MSELRHPSDTGCPVSHGGANTCPAEDMAAAFDFFEGPYLADPAEALRWSRERLPVFFSPQLGYWVVTRHDDIKAVFWDNILFSPRNALEKITPASQEAMDVLASYGYAMNRTMVNEDEPAHMARRSVPPKPAHQSLCSVVMTASAPIGSVAAYPAGSCLAKTM